MENFARGERLELEPAVFRPARELSSRRMKFAVGRQYPQAARVGARASGGEADDEIVGVRSEDDRGWIATAKFGRDLGLRGRPQLAHDPVPLAIGKPRRVVPAFDLPVETGIRPQMMAVRRHVQTARRGTEAARE